MECDQIISIVIRVKNAEEDLERCLNGILYQKIPKGHKIEIVVVDNESSDESEGVARKFGAKIVSILDNDFSWGRSLNHGINHSTGDIIIIISADAYAANNEWLIEMIKPLRDPSVAAIYGRQIARPDAPIDEIVRIKKTFGMSTIIAKSLPQGFTRKGGVLPVSNACAAIRKIVWEDLKYDEEISGAEDVIWTYNVFLKGYSVVYNANACVYHSHNETFFRNSWRELELLKKNIEMNGGRIRIVDYVRYSISFVKRRMLNVILPGLNTCSRAKGLLFLPIELYCFALTSISFHNHNHDMSSRSFFWKK
jgi:rhamnosyltransferase